MEMLPVLEGIGRVAAAGVFIAAGATKLRIGPRSFARAILAYHLLPERLVAPSAYAIPVLELFLGVALLAGVFVRASAIAGAVLLITFSAALAIALVRGQRNACGCGLGVGAGEAISRRLLARNAVLTTLLLVASLSTEGLR